MKKDMFKFIIYLNIFPDLHIYIKIYFQCYFKIFAYAINTSNPIGKNNGS